MTESQAVKADVALQAAKDHSTLMVAFAGSERGGIEENDLVKQLKIAARALGYKLEHRA